MGNVTAGGISEGEDDETEFLEVCVLYERELFCSYKEEAVGHHEGAEYSTITKPLKCFSCLKVSRLGFTGNFFKHHFEICVRVFRKECVLHWI